jgi:GTP diphosphokinase / guanosine-3',5'-bis(diphosphate) 3'-diphosphatase
MIRFDNILEKVASFYSESEIILLQKAYVFAAQAHKGQVRRSGEPYFSHPLEVTSILADMKMDSTTLAASLLHDVLEDTDVSVDNIKEAFGEEIAYLVEGVTKISLVQESSPENRKAESIRKIILAMTDDFRVIFIKLADRIHNLKTLKYLPEEKQKQIARETLEIYAPIANRLGMGKIKAELEDNSFRYVDTESYFKISEMVDPKRKNAEKELKRVKKLIESLMKENNIPAEIQYRIKRLYSIYIKMMGQSIDFDQVYDFMALRLITDSVKNCYAALGIIHQNWPHLPNRFRDFISMPKPNQYQALHTTILTEKKQTIELQFRTQNMHELAENGIAAHWKYKEKYQQPTLEDDRRLVWLREMAELYKEQKSPKEFLKSLKTDLIPEEVYVFTPKGKAINMPLGASALDFAFKIHSEIGLHAVEAKITSRPAPLKTILKTGDIVEIITSPEKNPSRDWLNIISTSSARHHIKRWLNQQEKIKSIAIGKKIWEQVLKKYNIDLSSREKKDLLPKLHSLLNIRIKNLDSFFSYVGSGKVILNRKLIENIFPESLQRYKKRPLIRKVVTRVARRPKSAITVKGKDDPRLNLAKCCSPIKGEPIIGYITAGKGITIHSQRCPFITKEILSPDRMVEAFWDSSAKGIYKGRLLIKSQDTQGLLAKLTAEIAHLEGDITKAEVATYPNKKAEIKFSINIKDIKHLEEIMKKIAKIKEIISVKRI